MGREDIGDAELNIPGYNIFKKDRPINAEGGVLLYIRDYLEAVEYIPKSAFPK